MKWDLNDKVSIDDLKSLYNKNQFLVIDYLIENSDSSDDFTTSPDIYKFTGIQRIMLYDDRVLLFCNTDVLFKFYYQLSHYDYEFHILGLGFMESSDVDVSINLNDLFSLSSFIDVSFFSDIRFQFLSKYSDIIDFTYNCSDLDSLSDFIDIIDLEYNSYCSELEYYLEEIEVDVFLDEISTFKIKCDKKKYKRPLSNYDINIKLFGLNYTTYSYIDILSKKFKTITFEIGDDLVDKMFNFLSMGGGERMKELFVHLFSLPNIHLNLSTQSRERLLNEVL